MVSLVTRRAGLAVLACLLFAPVIRAAEPTIRTLDVRGLRIGGTTNVVVDGDDLGKSPRLLLPFSAKQILKPGATDKRAAFEVTLAEDVIAGYHHLRVVTDQGISLPVVIGVDRLPQKAFTPTVDTLPIALHGSIAGSGTVETRFQGKAKQKVMIEVEAQRLGSKLRPILHLYGPSKLQVAWSWNTPALFGDVRLEVVLPEDGAYTVSLHDAEYAAAASSFFRLKIGEWSFVDQVFPPVVARARPQAVELLGMSSPQNVNLDGAAQTGVLPVSWPKGGSWSGPRPFVLVSSRQEFIQQPPGAKMQELPEGSVGVSGRLLAPLEEDRYLVHVSPAKKLRLEVFAERIGSPLDVALVIRNDKGVQLARAEDSPGTLDPVLDYTVPDKMTAIIVGVVDAQGRGGPRGVYWLTIDPGSSMPPPPKVKVKIKGKAPKAQVSGIGGAEGFRLTTTARRVSLPAGGHRVVPVAIERRGYQGKVELSAAKLPAGVLMGGTEIPAGAEGTLVTLERGVKDFDAAITTWRGRTADGEEQAVLLKGHPLDRLQPWLATEIALAPSAVKAADFVIEWRDLPADASLMPTGKLVLPIKTTRPPKTTVKLTLVTSQVTPLINNQPDPNKALRQEKAVELPAKADTGDIAVLVPADLSAPVYDVTVQAELLAADKKVIATSFAPVRRMEVRTPLVVRLVGPDRIEAALDPKKGATVKLQGKLERRTEMKADVLVTLAGLPTGAKADNVTVKAGTSDFTLNVVLPPTVAAGEITGLKLSASAAPNPQQPNVRVKSREVEVTLIVKGLK